MESLIQKRDQIFRVLVELSRQEQYDIESMKVLMKQLKDTEEELKKRGYRGPYLSDKKSGRRKGRSRSPRKKRSRSRKKRQRGGARKKPNVQSIMFNKHLWTVPKAVEWLDKRGFGYDNVDTTGQYLKFIQFPPYGRMRTVVASEKDCIKEIISYPIKSRRRSRSSRKRSKSKKRKRSKSPRKRSKSKKRKRSASKKR